MSRHERDTREKPLRALDRLARGVLGSRWGRRVGFVCLGVVMISSYLGTQAFGSFTSPTTTPTAMSLTANTLAAPTGLSANVSCQLIILLPQAQLSWNTTSSAFADGYQVYRSTTSGGPYSLITSLGGLFSTSFLNNTGLGLGGTYYYVVRATRGNWTSSASAQLTVNAPVLCL